MKLRTYHTDDWLQVAQLMHDTIHAINSAHYTQQQLDAWAPHDLKLPDLEARLQSTYSIIVQKTSRILGFGNAYLETASSGTDTGSEGYFDCLYTHKDYQRMGIATMMADDIEAYLTSQGAATIAADVSIPARPFFTRRGYIEIADQQVECRGQLFTNTRMVKRLR
ncbi:MAG: GNAT family N-acetyltransferase [Coriobacteriia bacterium]|nr:GNAT family N-acetyltransferase [Coriobacteriia bacterium]